MKLSQMFTERIVFYILVVILIITTLVDMYTAFTSPIFEIAETNPLYLLIGSIAPLIIISFIAIIFLLYHLNKGISLFKIYLFSLIIVYLSFGHLVGAYSNILATNKYNEDPETVEKYLEEEAATTKQKIISYNILIGVFIVLPIILSSVAFYITTFLYHKKKPERDKIIYEIKKLADKIHFK